jgi:hypothetical protein
MTQTSFLAELKRRNVIRMAGLYLVGAWLITQVASTLLPGFEAPPWVFRTIVMLLAVGFVPALVFAWVYEITPEGIKRESEIEPHESITSHTGRRIDRAILTLLALAIVVFAIDRFVVVPRREAERVSEPLSASTAAKSAATASAERGSDTLSTPAQASIAVLPFVNMSDDKANEYFSDGISEELLNLLAKIPQLAGDGPHLVVRLQGQGNRHPRDRAHVARGARARGLGSQGRQFGAHHGAADQGRHR